MMPLCKVIVPGWLDSTLFDRAPPRPYNVPFFRESS